MNRYRFTCIGLMFLLLMIIAPMHGCVTGGTKPASDMESSEISVSLDSVKELEDRVIITLSGNAALNYTPYRLESPIRLVIDIPDAVFVEPEKEVTGDTSTVSKVTKLNMTSDGRKVARMEVYLVEDTNYFVSKPTDNEIQVEVQKLSSVPVTETSPESPAVEPVKTSYPPATKIINIVSEDQPEGTMVTVLTDGSVENFESFVLESPYRLVVDIKGLKNTFPGKEIKTGGVDIKLIRIGTYPDKTRVVMESSSPDAINTYNVFPLDNKLVVSFRKAAELVLGSIPPATPSAPVEPAAPTVPETTPTTPAPQAELPMTELAPSIGYGQPPTTPTTTPATLPGETTPTVESPVVPPGVEPTTIGGTTTEEKVYTGKPMTLIFSNAKVTDLINLIAEFSNVSIVIKPEVPPDAKISLRLKKVPWDQALDLIVSLSGLGMVQRGNVIIVTTKANLNEETKKEYEFKRDLGDVEPLITRQVNVVYRKNPALTAGMTTTTTTTTPGTTTVDLVTAITNAKMLSARGSIAWAPSGDMIIVTDTESRVDEIVKMIRILDTPDKEPEVRIEARIVEMNDTFEQDLGIKWVAGINDDGEEGTIKSAIGNLDDNTNLNDDSTGARPSYFDAASTIFPALPATALGPVGGATAMIGLLDDALRLDVQLHALENLGEAQIIESPKVRVLNNVQATLEITTSIPQSNPTEETDETGTVTVTSTIEYKDFATKLVITPTVNPDGRIKLDLDLTHNTQGEPVTLINESGIPNTYYTEFKKNLVTKVLVDNRDTIVIGGLYRKESGSTEEGLPALKDIPLLGWLFKTKHTTDSRRELLIFITPTIVRSEDEVSIGK